MSVDQGALEVKLLKAKKALEQERARAAAIRKAQEAQMAQMLLACMREYAILMRRPSPEDNDINQVAKRHARRVLAVAMGEEAL